MEKRKKGKNVAIGIQNFEDLIKKNCFYVDKTGFIKEWWDNDDSVTLISRPRRFGKTLTMSMVETFFSNKYKKREDIFCDLAIWQDEKYRALQGTYPVISLSFANIKEATFEQAREKICQIISDIYEQHAYLPDSGILGENSIKFFKRVKSDMKESDATLAIHHLSDYLSRYYGKKVIILLDEYDTPMQEAYVHGYWDELVAFTRSMFNSMFKTNPSLERAIMTGVTRVSKESVFSDLNNLEVVTTSSKKYADKFGFTEEEVFKALDESGYHEEDKKIVKAWYDGFIFGEISDIYNPWSIINYLDKGEVAPYWANTSSNSLVGKLIREGNVGLKEKFECLMRGEAIETSIDEQIVYSRLNGNEEAVWSLLLASGYLKIAAYDRTAILQEGYYKPEYQLMLTNREVKVMFRNMISDWFSATEGDYNEFIKALLKGDLKAMNVYMNHVALTTFSFFDTGKRKGVSQPERFYHGFVLGLLVDLAREYEVISNRESGFGRYDIMIIPREMPEKQDTKQAIIIEFKVYDSDDESSLLETVKAALKQIEDKKYEEELLNRGMKKEMIRKYGFAFEGKKVLIGE